MQGYGPAVKTEEEVERAAVGDLNVVDHVAVDMNVAVDRHMNVNVTSSGQGTKTVILQIPKVGKIDIFIFMRFLIQFLLVSGHQIRRWTGKQKLYENVLDLVLGTLYIT